MNSAKIGINTLSSKIISEYFAFYHKMVKNHDNMLME